MNKTPANIESPSPEIQQQAMQQALANKRMKIASKKRLDAPNEQDDEIGQ